MQENRDLSFLKFSILSPYQTLFHAVMKRSGGESVSSFAQLNLSDSVGDCKELVEKNRKLVLDHLGFLKIVYARQDHGKKVFRVTLENLDEPLPFADALFTTEKKIALAITHADCQAAIFYDPCKEVVALAHSGWRGSVLNIYQEVIQTLQKELFVDPKDLVVAISPSLGPDHAEFQNYQKELPFDFWTFETKRNHFDFWQISKNQLLSCGVLEKNIEIASICTFCESKDYFSYRRDKICGRNATIAGMIH